MNLQDETADRMLDRALVNYPNYKGDTSLALMLWLEAFDRVDDALIMEAFKNTLKQCRFFPTVADIQKSIDEIKAQSRNIDTTPRLDRPKHYELPIIAKVMEMVRSGDTEKFVAEMEIEPELTSYARKKFPQISDELIRKNYLEIRQAYDANDKCRGCMWLAAECVDKGHYPVMELDSKGYISLRWQRCQKGAK